MRLALVVIVTLLSACADLNVEKMSSRTGGLSTDERKALYHQAHEGARQSLEQYIATTRPALQLKFRREYPRLTEAEIDVLVDDALEKGLHQQAGRRRAEPLMRPLNNCMSAPLGSPNFPNCY